MVRRFHIATAFVAVLVLVLGMTMPAGPAGAQSETDRAWFEVEDLNTGLPDAPPSIDRDTPRGTVQSLLSSIDTGRGSEAAHLLDLREIPPADQETRGAELARKLETLVGRKIVIDWSDLPDRPDALLTDGPEGDPMTGVVRRSILLWELPLDGRPRPIRLDRLKPAGGDPVWLFSDETVEAIPALYARYGPSRLERALPDMLRQPTIFGLLRWELIGLPLLIAGTALLGWAVYRAVTFAATRIRSKTLGSILRAIRGPAVLGVATALIYLGTTTVFVFSGRLDTLLTPLTIIGAVFSLVWLIINAIDALLDRLLHFGDTDLTKRQQQQNRALATRVTAGRRAFIIIVVGAGIAFVISSARIFENLGFGAFASAGALTLIVAFAARRILGNIMSSLQIAMNQSAKIGDRVVFRDHLCHVERINFTFVQLRDWDGTRLVVPVEEFVTEPFENWTMSEPEMLRIIKLKLAHEADVEAMRQAFFEEMAELDQDELDDAAKAGVYVAGQDVFGIDVWFALPCADPNTSWQMACLAREALMRRGTQLARETDRAVFPDANPAEAA